jgi:hypothetical protein
MNNKILLLAPLVLILLCSAVLSETYTKTGAKDFNVFIDPQAELSGFVYGTVRINMTAYPGEEFRCVDSVFYDNGTLTHIQSNPPHSPQNQIEIFSNPAQSPETLGYFPIQNGVGNIYYRSKDLIPYNNFTLVVFCNSNNSQLVYEEDISPVYGQAFKDLPSRGVWFAQGGNADMIVIVAVVLLLLVMFIFYKFIAR